MTTLFAQPYDISATGFYFESQVEFRNKAAQVFNDYGDPVEEFEIQFIDGEDIDCSLATAIELSQGYFYKFFELCDELDEFDKITFVIVLQECGFDFNPEITDPSTYEIDIYEMDTLRDLAEFFVDEGLMGDIPDNLGRYFDYDALARDLSYQYSTIRIAGKNYVYACG